MLPSPLIGRIGFVGGGVYGGRFIAYSIALCMQRCTRLCMHTASPPYGIYTLVYNRMHLISPVSMPRVIQTPPKPPAQDMGTGYFRPIRVNHVTSTRHGRAWVSTLGIRIIPTQRCLCLVRAAKSFPSIVWPCSVALFWLCWILLFILVFFFVSILLLLSTRFSPAHALPSSFASPLIVSPLHPGHHLLPPRQ